MLLRKVFTAMNRIFSGTVQVSIQGDRVLRFVDFTGNQAKYEVIGFENSPVLIIDSRAKGLLAIQELIETEELHAFAPRFNHQAMVQITKDDTGNTLIELSDTEDVPTCVLWIAIGLGSSMPVYDYVYEELVPLTEDDQYALIAVYQIPSSNRPALSSRELSSASSSSSLSAWLG